MVLMLATWMFSTPLDLPKLANGPASAFVRRWGAPERTETWEWTGRASKLPAFRTVSAYRDAAPVPGWRRVARYTWRGSDALAEDGLRIATVDQVDGRVSVVSLCSLSHPKALAETREGFYPSVGLSLPPVRPGTTTSHGVTQKLRWRGVEWDGSYREQDQTPDLPSSIVATFTRQGKSNVSENPPAGFARVVVRFCLDGGPESVEYRSLPHVGEASQTFTMAGVSGRNVKLAPERTFSKDILNFSLVNQPDWRATWVQNPLTCDLAFGRDVLRGVKATQR